MSTKEIDSVLSLLTFNDRNHVSKKNPVDVEGNNDDDDVDKDDDPDYNNDKESLLSEVSDSSDIDDGEENNGEANKSEESNGEDGGEKSKDNISKAQITCDQPQVCFFDSTEALSNKVDPQELDFDDDERYLRRRYPLSKKKLTFLENESTRAVSNVDSILSSSSAGDGTRDKQGKGKVERTKRKEDFTTPSPSQKSAESTVTLSARAERRKRQRIEENLIAKKGATDLYSISRKNSTFCVRNNCDWS